MIHAFWTVLEVNGKRLVRSTCKAKRSPQPSSSWEDVRNVAVTSTSLCQVSECENPWMVCILGLSEPLGIRKVDFYSSAIRAMLSSTFPFHPFEQLIFCRGPLQQHAGLQHFLTQRHGKSTMRKLSFSLLGQA